MSDDYEIWEEQTLSSLNLIELGINNLTTGLQEVEKLTTNAGTKADKLENVSQILDGANDVLIPMFGMQSVFQIINDGLNIENPPLIELGHDIEVSLSLDYLYRKYLNRVRFEEKVVKIGNISMIISQEKDPIKPPFVKASDASSSCHIIGVDQLGIEVKLIMKINEKIICNPTLHITLSSSINEQKKLSLSITRGARLCNIDNLNQKLEEEFRPVLSINEIKNITSRQINDLVKAAANKFPKTFEFPEINEQLTGPITFYNSIINQNRTISLFALSKSRPRNKFSLTSIRPNWADIALKLDIKFILDIIDSEIKRQGVDRAGGFIIQSEQNSILFEIKTTHREEAEFLAGVLKVAVIVEVKVNINLIFTVFDTNRILIQPHAEEPQISYNTEPVDVSDIPVVKDWIKKLIQKEVESTIISSTDFSVDPIDIYSSAKHMEISLQPDRFLCFIQD